MASDSSAVEFENLGAGRAEGRSQPPQAPHAILKRSWLGGDEAEKDLDYFSQDSRYGSEVQLDPQVALQPGAGRGVPWRVSS